MFFPYLLSPALSPSPMSYFFKWDATGYRQGLVSRAGPEDNSECGPWSAGAMERGSVNGNKTKQTKTDKHGNS